MLAVNFIAQAQLFLANLQNKFANASSYGKDRQSGQNWCSYTIVYKPISIGVGCYCYITLILIVFDGVEFG